MRAPSSCRWAEFEQNHARQLARGRSRNDLAREASLREKGNAAAMIEMGVGEQERVDLGWIEAKPFRVRFLTLATALIDPQSTRIILPAHSTR